jgi:hypothetical protein
VSSGRCQFDNLNSGIHNGEFGTFSLKSIRMQSQQPLNSQSLYSDRSQRRTSVWRVGLCWLLCLSVWRGPVPVVHEHSLDLKSLANNSQLAEHVIAFHADGLGHEGAGLHFHFILLDLCCDSLLANSDVAGQHDVGSADSFLKLEQQQRCLSELNSAQAHTNYGDVLIVAEDLRFSSVANASFLQTRLSSTPACAVLCVFLC